MCVLASPILRTTNGGLICFKHVSCSKFVYYNCDHFTNPTYPSPGQVSKNFASPGLFAWSLMEHQVFLSSASGWEGVDTMMAVVWNETGTVMADTVLKQKLFFFPGFFSSEKPQFFAVFYSTPLVFFWDVLYFIFSFKFQISFWAWCMTMPKCVHHISHFKHINDVWGGGHCIPYILCRPHTFFTTVYFWGSNEHCFQGLEGKK